MNKHEGSIPFTRSIYYQVFTKKCRKSAGKTALTNSFYFCRRSVILIVFRTWKSRDAEILPLENGLATMVAKENLGLSPANSNRNF
jgi:hypothetical protein